MNIGEGKKYTSSAKALALVGIAAATLECGKLVLSFLPNVEVATILVALYGYVFGTLGVLAAVVFVCIEPLIYGFNTWVILYFVYWPLVALTFMFLRRLRVKNRWLITGVAVTLTVLFGILSSLIDTAVLVGVNSSFFKNFAIYYARGIVFYTVQICSNAVLFPLLFNFLATKLNLIKRKMRLTG